VEKEHDTNLLHVAHYGNFLGSPMPRHTSNGWQVMYLIQIGMAHLFLTDSYCDIFDYLINSLQYIFLEGHLEMTRLNLLRREKCHYYIFSIKDYTCVP
jgi:hypothetical protein